MKVILTHEVSSLGTAGDVVDVKDAIGTDLDKRKIEVPTPIKTTGAHEALVRLHPEVQAKVTLNVVAG
jgi:large subunit ribosomal protein L9